MTSLLDSAAAGGIAIRGSALRVLGYGAAMALSLASLPLLTRHLGVVDFGKYVVVLAIVTVLGGLTDAGIVAIGMREYVLLEGPGRDAVMRTLLAARIGLTIGGIAVAVAFAALAGYESTLIAGTALAGIGLLAQVLQTFYTIGLQAELRYGWVTLAELARQAGTVVVIVLLVLLGAGLIPFFAAGIPAGVAAVALTIWLVRGRMPARPSLDISSLWPLLRESLPYSAAMAVNVLYFRLAVVLISLLAGGFETGLFAASFRVVEVLIAVPALLLSAVFPLLARSARDDPARFSYIVQRVFDVTLILGAWTALAVGLGAGFVIDVLAGEQASGAVRVLEIQAAALAATFVGVGASFTLLALRNHRQLLVANGVALLVTAVAASLLIGPLGARGAAIATVLAEGLLALILVTYVLRDERVLSLSTGILPPVALALALSVPAALLPLHDVGVVAIASAMYFGALAAGGKIPSEIRHALRSRGVVTRP